MRSAPASRPSEKEMAHACGDALQYGQIEIDDIPARQHVGIDQPHAFAKCVQGRRLIDAAGCVPGHGSIAAVDDEHFIDARRVDRDRQQPLGLAVGFDVERQHTRFDFHIGGPQRRILEYPRDPGSGDGLAIDLASPLDAALDQIPGRKGDVRLERLDAGRMKAISDAGNLRRNIDFEQAHRRAVEGAFDADLRLR